MTTPNEPNKTRTIPLHIADQAVAACEAEIQKLKEENARLKDKSACQTECLDAFDKENARLKAEVERLTVEADWKTPARKIKALEAEVERLRKAGDDMASSIQFNEEMEKDYDGPTIVHPSVERWNAAKEGKPSV